MTGRAPAPAPAQARGQPARVAHCQQHLASARVEASACAGCVVGGLRPRCSEQGAREPTRQPGAKMGPSRHRSSEVKLGSRQLRTYALGWVARQATKPRVKAQSATARGCRASLKLTGPRMNLASYRCPIIHDCAERTRQRAMAAGARPRASEKDPARLARAPAAAP